MEVIQLDGYTLTRTQIEKIAKGYAQVSLTPSALERVRGTKVNGGPSYIRGKYGLR